MRNLAYNDEFQQTVHRLIIAYFALSAVLLAGGLSALVIQ